MTLAEVGNRDSKIQVMDLLDELWFFRNSFMMPSSSTLPSKKKEKEQKQEQEKEKEKEYVCKSATSNFSNIVEDQDDDDQAEFCSSKKYYNIKKLLLLRMPTLPAVPRLVLVPCSSYPKLLHSMSALESYQSPSITSKVRTYHDKLTSGDRPPRRHVKLEKSDRYSAIRNYIAREAYYRKTFKEKKWKSVNDLEHIEIQGLKDLGFSYKNNGHLDQEVDVVIRKPPPPMFRSVDKKCADDMKDHLRFWAKAVASNTRELQ